MKLDTEPRLTGVGPTLMEWARKVVQVVNSLVDSVAGIVSALPSKAPIDSPNFTGTPTAPTPASSDNSTRIATTAWAKMGFIVLWAANGYIKLPDWLGGWVVQWGLGTGPSGSTGVTFPIAFPTACRAAYTTISAAASITAIVSSSVNSISTTGMAVTRQYWNGSSLGGASESFYWLAIGN